MLSLLAEQIQSVGGPVLVALAILSLVAATAACFKIFDFTRLGVGRHAEARALMKRWQKGDGDAVHGSAMSPRVTTQVLHAAIASLAAKPGDKEAARRVGIQTATERLARMSRHLRLLEAVVQAAPMLGLLGTVIGMIDAFGKLSEASGAVDPSLLAGGIWVALTTTAVGLTVAIPFYFLAVWFEGRIERERMEMEALLFGALEQNALPGSTIVA